MRFDAPKTDGDLDRAADVLRYAHEKGVNYFDTAPLYCEDRSEEIVGRAIRGMEPGSYYVSTKSGEADGDALRRNLERSLQRLGLDRVHFFHVWCLLRPEKWEERVNGGAIDAVMKARDEGLIEHVVFSTHMTGDETAEIIKKGLFEGVTLGFNAVNFPFRRRGVEAARQAGIGVVTMNPLSGGLIPQYADRFSFIRDEGDPDTVSAALRFNVSYPGVTCALVGFNNKQEVDAAVAAVTDFEPRSETHIRRMEEHIQEAFEGLCTGCGYCLPCPAGVPIPKYMDAYNLHVLGKGGHDIQMRLKWHWDIKAEGAAACTACGQCEQRCTQHLPIIERLSEVVRMGKEESAQG
jgi:hypothetical protein